MTGQVIGVVWLNTGGPADEAGVERFIQDMLSDPLVMPVPWPIRPWLARRIAARRAPRVVERYRRVGLPSPVYEHSRRQVARLEQQLGYGYAVELGFRYSAPRPGEALQRLRARGVSRVVGLAAYPQWSQATSLTAYRALERAGHALGMELLRMDSFPTLPGYLEALAEAAGARLEPGATVLFCAHGLPARLVERGDPYRRQVEQTVAALAERLQVEPRLAFQSRVGRLAWLRPYLDEEVERLARQGVKSLLVVPVSFVCENLETLHELDVELRELAERRGIEHFARVAVPATHAGFMAGLAGLVRRMVASNGWEVAGG